MIWAARRVEPSVEAAATPTPGPELRTQARSFLHPALGEGGPLALNMVAAQDEPAAGWLECARQAGQLMAWLDESGASPVHGLAADRLECAAWSRAVARVRRLAGEEL